jgi:hypothetical protein
MAVTGVGFAFVKCSEWLCPYDLDNPTRAADLQLTLPELMLRTWRLKLTRLAMLLSRRLADIAAMICPFNIREPRT